MLQIRSPFGEVVTFMLISGLVCLMGADAPKALSVCQVLKNLYKYRDKVISVRGRLIRTEEGTYLSGPKCAKPLTTERYTWSNPIPIFLVPIGSSLAENPERSVAVSIDPQSAATLSEAAESPDAKILVTFIGRIETRKVFEIVRRGDGKMVPHGYGHLNACPAQLVYYAIKDVVLENPTNVK